LIADVACPVLSGRVGLKCLFGRLAISELPFDLELLAHWNVTLAAVRRFNHDTSVGSGR
jgi:hypothetical protein